ncbi:UTP--glucose-1-phosphate uridylyltransferase GalU [Allobranchiibius sp. GilTou38]|uniref:UTP--glucose-1-phosphate uridylyltransferase GalU n=1 Tax=Allobranchiibius sp. GilTou38 TaxID=2815210 RepID=UPI001AA1A48C|nr:UTP--glucose-1-phosphate uridylyltransferase GalU [Allobranchiibius sp. GilTou38]MBO1765908.1 UTP--glucose-1-phosphate uridylyltransferase GalU [Allobranchiibius sp. GilTou38]
MTAPHKTDVHKAVIPAAGLGTRFLPATKAIPKEMLPVVDKPAIQYVVEEAIRAGCDNILTITGRNKSAMENHFDRHWELEQALERKGDELRLDRVRKSANLGNVHFIRQGEPLGLGHAVLCARPHVGDEPFAVLLGDDLIDETEDLLERMIAARGTYGGSVVALMEVPEDQVQLYGCADVESIEGERDLVRVKSLVEKPEPGEAPSNLAIIGRYVLDPAIFDALEKTEPGRGGEIQLTDAMLKLTDPGVPGGGVTGVIFRGNRYDTGDRLDYLKAVVRLAARHRDFGDTFRDWVREWAASDEAAGKAEHRLMEH